MSYVINMCAACTIAFAGTLALAFPADVIGLAKRCQVSILGHAAAAQSDPAADARKFDEILAELNQVAQAPRPEMTRDPYMPHLWLPARRAERDTQPKRIASAGPKIRTPRVRASHIIYRQKGIYARSRLGAHRARYGENGNEKSIFEQSRFYDRNGSAYDRIGVHQPYRK